VFGDLLEALRRLDRTLAEPGGQLQRRPDGAALSGGRAQEPEGVRGDTSGGGGERADEGLVVEWVG
jgi:hypothetical protein